MTYESGYINLTLAGCTGDGEPLALVAGRHGPFYPYFTPESEWDSVLLMVGGCGYAVSARQLPTLRLDVDTDAPAGSGRLSYDGPARRGDGAAARLSFDLAVGFQRFDALHLGRPLDLLRLGVGPGMRWQPFRLVGAQAPGDHLQIDARRFELDASFGELERGTTVSFKSPRLAFSYDYLSGAYAAQGTAQRSSYAYVRFVSHALHRRGALGRLLDLYLTRTASAELTVVSGAVAPERGNGRGVQAPAPGDRDAVIVRDVIDLGLARLERQLVRMADVSGRALFGLREIFTAK